MSSRPDNIQSNLPFILNNDSENYELVRNFLEDCFTNSFDDLCITKDYYDIIDKKSILESIKKKSFDNIFFIVDENNILLAFADIKIDDKSDFSIVKIDNICNNFKYGKGYGKIVLTYIFNHFNDELINSKKIISLSPVTDVIPFYLKFKYPNFPKLPQFDDNFNIFECERIIHNSTDDGEILYGNSDIIKKYLLNNNYNVLFELLDEYKIPYNKDELDSKNFTWFSHVMVKNINKDKNIDNTDKKIIINYIKTQLKYIPINLPEIDNYISFKSIQRGGFIKNIKFNFIINKKKKEKKDYTYLTKIKKRL